MKYTTSYLNGLVILPNRKRKRIRKFRKNPTTKKITCGKCGRTGHNRQTCKKKKTTKKKTTKKKTTKRRCGKCGNLGHYRSTCTDKRKKVAIQLTLFKDVEPAKTTKKKATKKAPTKKKKERGMKPKFHFFTRSGSDVAPFAKGMIPKETETAPVFDKIYDSMVNSRPDTGRQMFYAFMRSVRPKNTLTKRVISILKKLESVKKQDGENCPKAASYRKKLATIKKVYRQFQDAMEAGDWEKALDKMRASEKAAIHQKRCYSR